MYCEEQASIQLREMDETHCAEREKLQVSEGPMYNTYLSFVMNKLIVIALNLWSC